MSTPKGVIWDVMVAKIVHFAPVAIKQQAKNLRS